MNVRGMLRRSVVIVAYLATMAAWSQNSVAGFQTALGPDQTQSSQFTFESSPSQAEVELEKQIQNGEYDDTTIFDGSSTEASSGVTLLRLHLWHRIALDSNALDHTQPSAGETRVFGHQAGPHRTSRAFAIVQIAVFDAVNAVLGGYRSYTGIAPAPRNTSINAAIAQAAHDTLLALYPSHKERLDFLLSRDLSEIPTSTAKQNGILLGEKVAEAILAGRQNDGSAHDEPVYGVDYVPSNLPGFWRQDPIARQPVALGGRWGGVRPFVMTSPSQFRTPLPPALTSTTYTTSYNEVKRLGGDGVVTPTERSEAQAIAGIYWGYDGTPGLGAPPRLYNQITGLIAVKRRSNVIQTARLLGLVNVALADAGIASWESKYFYAHWRPITGIRESDPGTGPTGRGDGNPNTIGDIRYSPLGAQASNLEGPNFTPPFPAYPSGHATFGGALFQMLRRFYGTDSISFTFVSDEFNGKTRDNTGRIRPFLPRSFSALSRAEEENGQSRIYLGIHWSYDKTSGITQGRRIADYVFANTLRPI